MNNLIDTEADRQKNKALWTLFANWQKNSWCGHELELILWRTQGEKEKKRKQKPKNNKERKKYTAKAKEHKIFISQFLLGITLYYKQGTYFFLFYSILFSNLFLGKFIYSERILTPNNILVTVVYTNYKWLDAYQWVGAELRLFFFHFVNFSHNTITDISWLLM